MDRKQLMLELDSFKLACLEKDCIRRDAPSVFEFEEIYQGVFIINVTVKKEWLEQKYNVSALNELIELLYQTTDAKTRESILTLRLCQEDEFSTVEYPTLPEAKELA